MNTKKNVLSMRRVKWHN